MSKRRINWLVVKGDLRDSATVLLALVILMEAGALVGSPIIYVWRPIPPYSPSISQVFTGFLALGTAVGLFVILVTIPLCTYLGKRYTYYREDKELIASEEWRKKRRNDEK